MINSQAVRDFLKVSWKKILLSLFLLFVVSIFIAKDVALYPDFTGCPPGYAKVTINTEVGLNCMPAEYVAPAYSTGYPLQIALVSINEMNIPYSISGFNVINSLVDFVIFYLISSLMIFFRSTRKKQLL